MLRVSLLLNILATLLGACALASLPAAPVNEPLAVRSLPTASAEAPATPIGPAATPIEAPTAAPSPTMAVSELTWSERQFPSPSGAWVATVRLGEPLDARGHLAGDAAYEEVILARTDGSLAWTVSARWLGYGLGGDSPAQFLFTPDERGLYFTREGTSDGCGGAFFELWRVDLETGAVTPVAPFTWGRLAPSPDGALAAYGQLALLDLTTGVTGTIALGEDVLPEWKINHLLWSPDGRRLVAAFSDECSPDTPTVLLSVEAATRSAQVLLRDEARRFTPIDWTDPERILVRDSEGQNWWLSAADGALTPAP